MARTWHEAARWCGGATLWKANCVRNVLPQRLQVVLKVHIAPGWAKEIDLLALDDALCLGKWGLDGAIRHDRTQFHVGAATNALEQSR